ncbi:MAG TPA: 2-amino-4-hydroxy-6-hydroxymethyldihydropteridine diphosphokinase, partial [Cryomorphaceae bacterium]|nr:2-amino-4-hydroxy-6-hydroxymethyldihydropteridine diphosphokinase [Cryomorphaceae bacterium]
MLASPTPRRIRKKSAARTPKKLEKNIFIGDLSSSMNQSNRIPGEHCQNRALLLLGSNSEDAVDALARARGFLAEVTEVVHEGSIWRTAAWGFKAPDFLNQVLEVCWEGDLELLMTRALEVEKRRGRVRHSGVTGYESRRMDIDVILWSAGEYHSDSVTVPHP